MGQRITLFVLSIPVAIFISITVHAELGQWAAISSGSFVVLLTILINAAWARAEGKKW